MPSAFKRRLIASPNSRVVVFAHPDPVSVAIALQQNGGYEALAVAALLWADKVQLSRPGSDGNANLTKNSPNRGCKSFVVKMIRQ